MNTQPHLKAPNGFLLGDALWLLRSLTLYSEPLRKTWRNHGPACLWANHLLLRIPPRSLAWVEGEALLVTELWAQLCEAPSVSRLL